MKKDEATQEYLKTGSWGHEPMVAGIFSDGFDAGRAYGIRDGINACLVLLRSQDAGDEHRCEHGGYPPHQWAFWLESQLNNKIDSSAPHDLERAPGVLHAESSRDDLRGSGIAVNPTNVSTTEKSE